MKPKVTNGMKLDNGPADTVNLLDSTDSDVEWLNLPPIKGKKPKKKKTGKISKESVSGCSACHYLKVFLLINLIGGMIVLSASSVWLMSQVGDLKTRLEQMESRNRGSVDDLQKLYQQMALVNKTLESHSSSFSHIQVNITTINNVISQLSGTMEKLDASIKAAPELKNLPDKLVTVSQSVAHLGSTVDSMQDTVNKVQPYIQATDTKLEDLAKQIQNIQVPVKPTDEPVSGFPPELSNLIHGVTEQMKNMNDTLVGQVDALVKSSSVYDERLSKLEEMVEKLSQNVSKLNAGDSTGHSAVVNLGDDTFKTRVESIVKNVISENGESVPGNSSKFEMIMQNLTTMAETLTTLEEKYHKQSSQQVDDGDYVTHSMFTELEEGFTVKVQGLNTTLTNLKSDVHTLVGKIVKQTNSVFNLTQHVNTLQQLITIIQEELQQPVPNLGPQLVTEKPSAEKTQPSEATPTKAPPTTIRPNTPITVTDTHDSNETGTMAPTVKTTAKKALITVDRIKTLDDFNLDFDRWDRGGTGKISYDVLDGYLGPALPERSVMETQVDKDHDGYYSQVELAQAFGFNLSTDDNNNYTTDEPTDTQPPR